MDSSVLFMGVIALFLVGVGLIGFMFFEAKQSRIKSFSIPISGLTPPFQNFSIYFLSDIHRRRLSRSMLKQASQPDIVVIGGDLTEKGVPFDRVSDNLEKLAEFSCPILFIWGNHDLHVDPYQLRALFRRYGVYEINNDSYIIERDGQRLNIIGVHDATNALDMLEIPLQKIHEGIRLLISHNPIIADKIRSEDRIQLVVCGHTHGGQIRIFNWGLREKGGLKVKDFGSLVISNGYGTTRYPLRLGAPPDTLWIQLEESKGK